jgi:hypothetical protein
MKNSSILTMRINRSSIVPLASAGAVILLMFLSSIHSITSLYQDIGRHITLGRIIWETGHIPDTNFFSYTVPSFPFVNHHWLAEVVLYFGDALVGLKGLILLKAVILTCAFGLAFFAAWRPRIAFPAMVIGIMSIGIMIERTDVRPEVFSFLFLGWYLFVLYRFPRTRLIWTLPLVQLFWVNTHIYFFIGPCVLIAWWVGRVIRHGTSELANQRIWLLMSAVAVATLLNPHGLHGALYPFSLWDNYGYSIAENKSPFFLRSFGYPQFTAITLYLFLGLGIVSFIANRKNFRSNVQSALLFVSTAVLALTMVRNFPLFALCGMPIIMKNIDEAGWRFRAPAALGWCLALTGLLGASMVTGQFYRQTQRSQEFGLIVSHGYTEPIDFYRRAGIQGPLFNNFDIGSFLIWKLPEEPVFIDGRPEAYPAEFIQDVYIPMQEHRAAWDTWSAGYDINAIFWNERDGTPWSRAFVQRILDDSQWVLVYRNHGIIILVRDVPKNASIVSRFRMQ